MPEEPTLTVAITGECTGRLRDLASRRSVTEDALAQEAIEAYLDHQDWISREIQAAIDEADSNPRRVPHEAVVAWARSWGTDRELPRPE